MNVELLAPLGAVVSGIELASVDDDDVVRLERLLAERGVVVLPDQHVHDDPFAAFLGRFGELTFTVGETPVAGRTDLNVVTNVGRDRPPRSSFHTDTSYVRDPPTHTALRIVEVPRSGGDTLFSDQYAAAATLPADVRAALDGRSIEHVVTGLVLDGDAESSAWHPALRTHPVSGRVALFLSTPQRCVRISGIDDDESARIVAELHSHSIAPERVLRHRWSPGDVVMWDNRCVMHRADHADVIGDRVLHRGMVIARRDPSP
ncbi:TauD/TfdA dioxygenase family protein [Ilumatobacter sp.]|uniref:TauD/TfdA dioxygenase family protein n=1 Tax=Ilumatobacter sp. TaxID=1967498 RepID=UPI003B51AC18